jgi:digeranylgeranylglycerophospholipid reductase
LDDVIVMGAGPGGNSAAYHLATMGYRITVIERKETIGDKLCSGIVGAECLERYPAQKSHILRESRSARFFSPSGVEVDLSKDGPQAYVMDRVRYVASIAEKAQKAGARYLLQHNVIDIDPSADLVEVTAEGPHGTEKLQAKAMVLGGGFGSRFTRRLGLGYVKDFTTGAQAEVMAPHLEEVQVYFGRKVAPNFFGWMVPTTGHKALVGLLSRRNAPHYLQSFISTLQARGEAAAMTKKASHWGVPLQSLARTSGHRVLVVGDAAGQVKPTTGGGIYYALLAGELAAQSLDKAFRAGDLGAEQLSDYDKSWKALMSHDLGIGRGARHLFETLKDDQIDSLMQTIATNGIRADILNSKEFSFDWHGGAIVRALGHPLFSGALRFISPLATRMAARMISN